MTDDAKDMRARAEAWIIDKHTGQRTTRDNALSEEHMALDVLELLDEVERLQRQSVGGHGIACRECSNSRADMHAAQEQLAAMAAARDKLADIIEGRLRGSVADDAGLLDQLWRQIAELRKVGS
jgi:hypothetical protein